MGNVLKNITSLCDECIKIQDEGPEIYYDSMRDCYYYYDPYNYEKIFLMQRRLSMIPETTETSSSSENISPNSIGSLNSENSPIIFYSPKKLKKREFIMEFERK